MNTHTRTTSRAAAFALSAALMAAAPAAQSQMYRWIDANGAVTYSNTLPSDKSVVKDLTVVLENPGSAVAEKRGSDAQRAPAASAQSAPSSKSDTRRPDDVLGAFERATNSAPVASDPPKTAAPRIALPSNAPEAVRDPCLRSADPKCYERNKAAYVPGRGYSPAAAVGATSSVGAGGIVGGGGPAPAPSKVTPPKPSVYALPPGSEPIPPLAPTKK